MTPFRSLLLSALLLASATSVFAARRERVIDTWRPVNYNVAITLNDRLTEITKARTEVTLQILKDNVTTVDLDFGEMTVDAVTMATTNRRNSTKRRACSTFTLQM